MKKILVIEDDVLLCQNTCDFLEMEYYQVLQANDGLNGMKLAMEEIPDLILCDIALPKMDGYKVYKTLQQNPSTEMIPFIFISGKTEKEEVRAGMHLGADDYITKPFELEELLAAIEIRLAKYEKMMNKSYENFQVLMDNPMFGVFMLQDDRIIFYNRKFSEMLGYQEGAMNQVVCSNLIHPGDRKRFASAIRQTQLGVRKRFHSEIRMKHRNQDYIQVESSGGVAMVENKPAILAIISFPGNSPEESQLMNYLDDIDTSLSTIIQKRDRVSEGMARRLVEIFDRKPEGEKFDNKEALTKREIEVLHHICRGMTNQQIADSLCVSIKTIDSHRTHLLEKTGSRNTAELVIYAIKNHLVELD